MNEYEEHFIGTFTGLKFHYLNPAEYEICIEDIAHALALTCRFGGHIKTFYSVAEHSIRVSDYSTTQLKLPALLHDAHEAYLHDVPRPIKQDIPQYKIIADKIQEVIWRKFNCQELATSEFSFKLIKYADDTLLATEASFLMHDMKDWGKLPEPLSRFKPLSWQKAEKLFLKKFRSLYHEQF